MSGIDELFGEGAAEPSDAGREVDELFGEDGTAAKPRTALVVGVLISGLALTVLGMACTAVPGGVITLIAWALVEREVDRVDSGFLPLEYRPALVTLRAMVWASLLVVLGLFVVQGVLLCNGTYFELWAGAVEALRPVLEGILPPVPEPPAP